MSWLTEQKHKWRAAFLVGMIMAVFGPWTYEQIHVPAEYACSPPFIRLEGDFCGSPILGIQLFVWINGGLISIGGSLISGNFVFTERIREILISLLMLFPLLPFVSTIILRWRGEQPSRQLITILAWILAIIACLFLVLNNDPILIWLSWGIWLYLGLAVSALTLEVLLLTTERNRSQ